MNKNEKQPAPRLRWKKNEALTGLSAIGARPQGSRLHDGIKEYANTCATYYLPKKRAWGWYWVARCDEAGVPLKNTCIQLVPTEDDAKKAAMEYVKACMAKRGEK